MLKCLLLNRFLCMWPGPWLQSFQYSLHVILLSIIRPRYITLFTKGMFLPFSHSTPLRILSLKETDRLNFLFIHRDVPVLTPQLHCSEAMLQFAENMMSVILRCIYSDIVCEQDKMCFRCCGVGGGHCIYIYRLYNNGARAEP
jgi:hypothetical protein